MVRRFVNPSLSVFVILVVGSARVDALYAQEKKETPKPAAPTAPAAKEAAPAAKPAAPAQPPAKPVEPAKKEEAKPVEPPLPPIPPEVQAKLEAARKAVAELIVAAQDAGLVETSIDPPPILDLLITGRATDARTIKGPTAKKPYAVSPEVFAAWFTSYGKLEGVNFVEDVRILNPSAGLKEWYDQRARMLDQYIQEIRKAKGPAPKKEEPKKAEPAPAPAAAKPAEAPKPAAPAAAEPKKK